MADGSGFSLLDLARARAGPNLAIYAGIALLVVLLVVPLVLLFARKSQTNQAPTVLLAGPSGAGKTALFLQWQDGGDDGHTETVTSTAPNQRPLGLAPTVLLVDTPGHEKLGQYVREQLATAPIRAAVFVVDAAGGADAIRRAARPLMAVLLAAERRRFAVLVAANKFDQFNSLSVNKVRRLLEAEIDELRALDARNVQSSEVSDDVWDHEEFLGLDGKPFEFADLVSEVAVLDGSVTTNRLDKWEDWLSGHLGV